MAKQVLDLYQLYKLVVDKGGLVEVINKKIWREITKGLNLPSSITSAAFTLRTQYMKYLYPFECSREKLSDPSELQEAIEGNRREGRRPNYGSHMFPYPNGNGAAMLTSPKFPFYPQNAFPQIPALAAKYGQGDERCAGLPASPTQFLAQQQQILQSANAQHAAAMAALETIQTQAKVRAAQAAQQAAHHAAQQAAQHQQMAMKKEFDSDYSENEQPPEKKPMYESTETLRRLSEEEHHPEPPQRQSSTNHLKISMLNQVCNIETNGNGSNDSIDISLEVNGIKYQGKLYSQVPNGLKRHIST